LTVSTEGRRSSITSDSAHRAADDAAHYSWSGTTAALIVEALIVAAAVIAATVVIPAAIISAAMRMPSVSDVPAAPMDGRGMV
jgi:hypothetical protein